MWRCKVCKVEFSLTKLKDKKYVAHENKGVTGALSGYKRFECVDCPYCGCQNVLNERHKEFDDPDDEGDEIVTETVTDDEADNKTRLGDCKTCWCNTCANIERCLKAPEGQEFFGARPFPCVGCTDGRRYMPKEIKDGDPISAFAIEATERCPCIGYLEGEENNE